MGPAGLVLGGGTARTPGGGPTAHQRFGHTGGGAPLTPLPPPRKMTKRENFGQNSPNCVCHPSPMPWNKR